MRKLFLTSTGLPLETRQYFLNLIGKPPQKLKVAFIPTAADPEEDKWFVDSAKKELAEIGFTFQEIDLKEDPKIIKEKLEDCDIIYINGGNTFYLLDLVRKSGLDKYISQLLDQGKIYVGVSAGSALAGPDIEIAGWSPDWDKNIVNLKDTTGLNLVPFAICPHFEESHREILKRNLQGKNYQIIPITNSQAILVLDKNYQVVGKGKEINLS